MKSVDSLNSALGKKKGNGKNSRYAAEKKRIKSFKHKEQAGDKNKILRFWALVIFFAGLIFISWLFFLKVEFKNSSLGGAFSKIFSPLGQAMINAQGELAKIKNINIEKILSENATENQNKEEVSPEIKELEERVFPQFEK